MLELVFAVCMIGAPERCKSVTLNFEGEGATPQQCMFYGQAEMAKWTNEHPEWRITKFRCGRAGQVAKI